MIGLHNGRFVLVPAGGLGMVARLLGRGRRRAECLSAPKRNPRQSRS